LEPVSGGSRLEWEAHYLTAVEIAERSRLDARLDAVPQSSIGPISGLRDRAWEVEDRFERAVRSIQLQELHLSGVLVAQEHCADGRPPEDGDRAGKVLEREVAARAGRSIPQARALDPARFLFEREPAAVPGPCARGDRAALVGDVRDGL